MPTRARLTGRRTRLAIATGMVVAIGVGVVGWRALVLQQTAQEARDHLTAARTALGQAVVATAPDASAPAIGAAQLTAACAEASAAAESLEEVNGQLQTVMPLVGALEALPGVGARARTQTTSLQAGTQVASAGASLCDGLAPLSSLLSGGSLDGEPQSAREIMQTLAAARPKLVAATRRLEQLQVSLGEIPDVELEPANRATFVAMRDRLPQVLKTMQDATVLLDLLGSSQPRRYVLVSQNPDELRATGGYIGSAGVVEAAGGAIRLVEYGTSRRYDTPLDHRALPPAEFQPYLGQINWNLAGANWWASFPDVARQLAYFYELSHPQAPVDGVIALDQWGLAHMLEVIGPVDVPDYGERVGAADVESKLDRYVHAGDSSDENNRKQFTAALSTAVLQQLMTAPRGSLPGMVKAVRATLDEQHLLVWVKDPLASQLFAARHWDGAILPAESDALMLVDTDVVSSKQSQAVSRDATYTVAPGRGEPTRATLDIVYTNNARPEQRPDVNFVPEYRTFLRVLVPRGSQLLDNSGFDKGVSTWDECGRSAFAGQVSIADRASTHVMLQYQLPANVTSTNYDLLVQQQPGVPPGHVAVAVLGDDGVAARAELVNSAGHSSRWHLDMAAAPVLNQAPLPTAAPGGCGVPLVEAQPTFPPVALSVPSIGLDASVVDLGVNPDGEMEAPPTPDVVGWYRMSSRPGDPGNSVMSGHVDWGQNTAVFWGLRKLRKGDVIEVSGTNGARHHYAVEWNETFPWQTAPVDRIVGPSADSLLTLITCDGTFDQHAREYAERRVVRARLID